MRLESQLVVIDGDDFKFFPFLNSVRLGVLPDLPVAVGAHGGQENIVHRSERDAAVWHENGFEQLARSLRIRLLHSAVSARRHKCVVERTESEWFQPAAASTAFAIVTSAHSIMHTTIAANITVFISISTTIRASSQDLGFADSVILVGNERLKHSSAVARMQAGDDTVRPEDAALQMHIAPRGETARNERVQPAANVQQRFGVRHLQPIDIFHLATPLMKEHGGGQARWELAQNRTGMLMRYYVGLIYVADAG
jgi:hypothetical protein